MIVIVIWSVYKNCLNTCKPFFIFNIIVVFFSFYLNNITCLKFYVFFDYRIIIYNCKRKMLIKINIIMCHGCLLSKIIIVCLWYVWNHIFIKFPSWKSVFLYFLFVPFITNFYINIVGWGWRKIIFLIYYYIDFK